MLGRGSGSWRQGVHALCRYSTPFQSRLSLLTLFSKARLFIKKNGSSLLCPEAYAGFKWTLGSSESGNS